MEQKEISVIIPAHNAENLISRAVGSVQQQTGMSWEILVIENGSTDQTFPVCLSLEQKDEHIRVAQSEKGVSKARNKGLDMARGTWICFLDADDYLYPGAFQILKEAISNKEKCDLYLFGHNSGNGIKKNGNEDINIYNGEECLRVRCEMLKDPTRQMTVWGKLFLRETIEKNHLRFDEELSFSEDGDFTFRYCKYCQRIGKINAELYHYSREAESAVRTYRKGMADHYIKALQKTSRHLTDEPDCIVQAFDYYILMNLLVILVHDTYAERNPMSTSEKKQFLKELTQIQIFAKSFSHIRLRTGMNARMLPLFFLKHHLYMPAVQMIKSRAKRYAGNNAERVA